MRSSARMVPSSIISPWSRTISREMMRCSRCCSGGKRRPMDSSSENGTTQTSASSSATASLWNEPRLMASKPSTSPGMGKPMICSRPSGDSTRDLKNPARMG